LSGSVELQIATDTTYVLRAENDAGDFEAETVTVTVGAPQILSFTATPSYAPAGGTVVFSWSNLGGSSLTLTDGSGTVIHSTSDLAEIEEADLSVQIPDEGEFEYTLTVLEHRRGREFRRGRRGHQHRPAASRLLGIDRPHHG